MEESLQQEQSKQQGLEYKNPNEGDFRCRLRNRDLLRKRKAEAEEKETSLWDLGTESPKKRGRAARRGRRRGRPRKTKVAVITDTQNDGLGQETPAAAAVGAVPVFSEATSDQTPSSLTPALAVPVFEPAAVDPTPIQAPDVDTAPILIQNLPPGPDAVSDAHVFQDPPQGNPVYAEQQSRAPLDQIVIEDLGPEEEEDLCPSKDKRVDEDLNEKPVISTAEENTFLLNPTSSSPPPPLPPQEYAP